MRGSTSAAVAMIGLLSDTVISAPSFTFLTVPQQDRLRARNTAATASISADGRYLAFTSYVRLSAMDLDHRADVYVLDRVTQSVTLETGSTEGVILPGDCHHPSISGDGRYVVFESAVFGGDPSHSFTDIVLRDRATATTRRISAGPRGASGNGWSSSPAIDAGGRAIVFQSTATNLLDGDDVNGVQSDIYLFEIETGMMRRISVDSAGVQHAGGSATPSVSAGGRYVVFSSTADLARSPDAAGVTGRERGPFIYVRDVAAGRTTRIGPSGQLPNGATMSPVISADGMFVAFVSRATNLTSGDRNRLSDVFLYEVSTGAVTLVSRGLGGGTANGASVNPAISADGRFVVFQSDASDMACARCAPGEEDINLVPDVFLFDRTTRAVTCVSSEPGGGWLEESGAPSIDASGQVIAFTSRHPISPRDTAFDFDLFVRFEEH